MHEIFSEVVREISVRKVEMKIKSKSRVNLFENENYTLFSINSFTHPIDYWKHINDITARVREQVELQYSQIDNLLGRLDFLELLYSDLRGIHATYLPEKRDLLLDSIQIVGILKYRNDRAILEVLKEKTLDFVEIQRTVITTLEEFLVRKIRSVHVRIKLLQSNFNFSHAIFEKNESRKSDQLELIENDSLVWNRSDTDLLELITALYESKSIISKNGKFTKKQLQTIFERLFHHTIKDAGSKLTRARDRKTETAVFMEELKNAFSNYVSKKDIQLDSRRK
jgi:hypothetical protein